MLFEVEQKFPVGDLTSVRQRLEQLGAKFEPKIEQSDLYFRHPSRNFKETDEALRLRRVGDANCITYKGPKIDSQTKTRREIELPLEAGPEARAKFAELLEVLGFNRVHEVAKQRMPGKIAWQDKLVHVALDEVEGLGSYVELEITAEQDQLESAKAALASLAGALNLSTSERRGYLDLLLGGSS